MIMDLDLDRHEDIVSVSPTTMSIFAILFASGSPVPLDAISEALDIAPGILETHIGELKDFLQKSTPLFIQEIEDAVVLKTRVEFGECIAKTHKITPKRKKLSDQALETLSIIAYRQPITKNEIDRMRGSDSERTLRTLLESGLVSAGGNLDKPGNPLIYVTTALFLERFNLRAISELPSMERMREIS
jgi:segregation and condensation protein B